MKEKRRVVVLIGPSIANRNTLATLVNSNVRVVGAVIADKNVGGVNTSFLKIAVKKQGIIKVAFQIMERVLYKLLNSKKDARIEKEIFDMEQINLAVDKWRGAIHKTVDYQAKETVAWIAAQKPDIIVIHTPYWVGKKIRNMVNGNVIGGHPGITPLYRGVHSPFWAIYKGDAENIGYSVFWVAAGVDTGDLISQGKVEPQEGDSYLTLSWRGMKEIAKDIAKILEENDQGSAIRREKNTSIPDNSIFYHPTIFQYLKYRFIQRKVR